MILRSTGRSIDRNTAQMETARDRTTCEMGNYMEWRGELSTSRA